MDFSRVELSDEDAEFQTRLAEFLASVVTDEVIERDRRTGENFDEAVHLALGEQRYLERDYRDAADGGFSRAAPQACSAGSPSRKRCGR